MVIMAKILDLHKADRPREKLLKKGACALSDFELLQTLIGSGTKQADVSQIARDVLKLIKDNGLNITSDQLEQVTGLGIAKITEIQAAFELSKRYLVDSERSIIDSPEKAVEQLANIRDKKQEHFVVLTLDGANQLIAKRTITIGTLTSSLVHPREVFAEAITDRAANIIVAHNHPSGTLSPSTADLEVTNRLNDAAKLLGIRLVDHIIVSRGSFAQIPL